MKVFIGPYVNFLGPYQIAEKILFWKDKYEDDIVRDFGKWLATTSTGEESLLAKVCQWIYKKKKRKVKIKVYNYDTWDVGATLSPIIFAVLTEFVKEVPSTAMVDKEDVPESLHSTYGEYREDDGGMSAAFSHEAWLYVLNEMIYAFDPEWDKKYGFGSDGHTYVRYQENAERQQRGYELFGKYFSRIWN